MNKNTLRVIPLGGLGEIGKNMMALEYNDEIVVIDCGIMFPRADMPGVDVVIPDIAYLIANQEKVRGIFLTHGHEDHIGALPYLLREMDVPIYGTELTLGLVRVRLEDRKIHNASLQTIAPSETIDLDEFSVTPFRVNHSIPDAVGFIIDTPLGLVIHTGDFKIDHTPVDGIQFDLTAIAQAGDDGVLLLMADSTYAEMAGYTPSEQIVGDAFDNIIGSAEGRVIIASFASLISRVQQAIDAAYKYDRILTVTGRSMVDNVAMALDMGYLEDPNNVVRKLHEVKNIPQEKIVLMTTGAQGEPTSALVRMSNKSHRDVTIESGDTVIISSNPIPGNELLVSQTIDNLFKIGARVFYSRLSEVHVRGHASREELKLMINLANPEYFIPVHGDFRHLQLHAEIAQSLGVPRENTFTLVNGNILEINENKAHRATSLDYETIYIDGPIDSPTLVDVNENILEDRKKLGNTGIIIVTIACDKKSGNMLGEPNIIARGFVDVENPNELWDRCRKVVTKSLKKQLKPSSNSNEIEKTMKDSLSSFLYQETRQRPVILPVKVEV
ncbi:MAG: ribonuclease J [SAR202 cluster bacterium]|nr:ribonuclease J [SAR202 cluster bacterium]|tara:strand:- start:197 stop:1864 length:1668 start_codon:yes stop_codon:yes gene_type:complete